MYAYMHTCTNTLANAHIHMYALTHKTHHIHYQCTHVSILTSEAKIAEIISNGHPYDIISFDFAKAFDKAPHDKVVNAIAALGIKGRALEWLSSFLAPTADVTSGVIQGSTLGPVLYDIFIDSLLRKIKLPSQAFADDFKFIADVIAQPRVVIQAEVDTIVTWADDHGTPLSIDKCSVLHCGKNQPNNDYYIKSAALKSVDRVVDLGVERSADATYSAHCARVVAKATRVCGMIRHFSLEQSQALVACIHLIRPSNINILLTGVEPISRSRHHRYRKSAAQVYQEDQRAQSSVIQRPSRRTTCALVVTEETVH